MVVSLDATHRNIRLEYRPNAEWSSTLDLWAYIERACRWTCVRTREPRWTCRVSHHQRTTDRDAGTPWWDSAPRGRLLDHVDVASDHRWRSGWRRVPALPRFSSCKRFSQRNDTCGSCRCKERKTSSFAAYRNKTRVSLHHLQFVPVATCLVYARSIT